KVITSDSTACTALRRLITISAPPTATMLKNQKQISWRSWGLTRSSPRCFVIREPGPGPRNLCSLKRCCKPTTSCPSPSPVRRVLRAGGGDLLFEAVADGQQLRLGDDVLAAVLEVVLVDVGLDDRIHRAALFAEAAVDALEQVDFVARGAPRAVLAAVRVDG